MNIEQKSDSKISFQNEPVLSMHEVDKKFNERRMNLLPHVKSYLANHPSFIGKNVEVKFAEKGISSLVCIINSSNEKVVLKISLSLNFAEGEGTFLSVWESVGVAVPHVLEEGILGGHQYTLMKYIDAPTVAEAYNSQSLKTEGVNLEMGQILSLMHKPKVEGCGRLVDGKPEFENFDDWINSPDMLARYKYVKENNLLNDEHGSLSQAIEILSRHAKINNSVYCHNDFGTNNIFATKPLTVFDPSPLFNIAYYDLARTLYSQISNGGFSQELLTGYFGNEPYDKKALHAAILINAYYKFKYAYETNRVETIKNVKEYLTNNKHLLD